MYIGERHSAETRETIDVEYRCRWCGLAKWARSSARGVGMARSPSFVDREGARDRAATSATSDALDIAEAALANVKCPGCGKTNAEKNATSPVVMVAGPLLVGALAGVWLFGGVGGGIGALVGALLGMAGILSRRTRAEAAAAGVVFFEGEPRDCPVIGKRCKDCDRQIVTAQDGTRCPVCGVPLHHESCGAKHEAAHGA